MGLRANNRSAAGFVSSLTDLCVGISRKWPTRGDLTVISTIFGRVVRCGLRKTQVANCGRVEKPSERCQVGPCRPLFANPAVLLHLRTLSSLSLLLRRRCRHMRRASEGDCPSFFVRRVRSC